MEFRRPIALRLSGFFVKMNCKQFAMVSLLWGIASEIF
jgi:hypothetical protein